MLGVVECEELKDFVLCGHSYGGMVITGVADRVPDQVRSLVYLDALVPTDGLTVLDLLPTESAAGLKESARPSATGFRVPPAPAEAFAVKAEDRDWVDRRCVDHPLKAFEQSIRLEDRWKQVGRTVYVHATGWHPGIGKTSIETARKKGWRMLSLDCGHDVMIDRPEDLTRILIDSK